MDSQRILIAISAVLAFICLFLGLQLYQKSETIETIEGDNATLTLERDQVLFDLENCVSVTTPSPPKTPSCWRKSPINAVRLTSS